MKSTILALLPLASIALAETLCPVQQTVTVTETEKVYETLTAAKVDAVPTSSTCSRRTVYTTTHEKVYVTVTAEAVEEAAKSTRTSTDYTTTTVVVRPSNVPVESVKSAYPSVAPPPVQPEASSKTYTPAPAPQSEAPKASSAAKTSSAYEAPVTAASPTPKVEAVSRGASGSGEATFYGGNVGGGTCSFSGYTLPSGIFGTALSGSFWSSASLCGSCVSVTGPSGTKITAMVVDQCPECGPSHPLDLFSDAFAKLANPDKGIIDVSWQEVPCGISSPIVLKNKSGTSKYWFSMQVVNANVRVAKLEVSTDGGKSWMGTTRKEYNYFENASGFGTDSVDVRITSLGGETVVVKGVSMASEASKTAGGNFSS